MAGNEFWRLGEAVIPAPGFVGLRNLGKTSYMNSVLQCLLHTPRFVASLARLVSGGKLGEELDRIAERIWNPVVKGPFSPRSFKDKVAHRFQGSTQHDAYEFLRYVLESLREEEDLVTGGSGSLIGAAFSCEHRSTVTCTACGQRLTGVDSSSMFLSLPIPRESGTVCASVVMSSEGDLATVRAERSEVGNLVRDLNRFLVDACKFDSGERSPKVQLFRTKKRLEMLEESVPLAAIEDDEVLVASRFDPSEGEHLVVSVQAFAAQEDDVGHIDAKPCIPCVVKAGEEAKAVEKISTCLKSLSELPPVSDLTHRRHDLYDCLEAHLKEERLVAAENWWCDGCCEAQPAIKKLGDLSKLREILVIQLRRFTQRGEKLDVPVDVPQVLDLTGYHLGAKFKLYAFISHFGVAESGHYIATIDVEGNDMWYEFNDDRVVPNLLAKEEFSSAYILFYKRHK